MLYRTKFDLLLPRTRVMTEQFRLRSRFGMRHIPAATQRRVALGTLPPESAGSVESATYGWWVRRFLEQNSP
jgi:hypothetical protein